MMEIISHRGYWHEPAEKNTRAAFERSFLLGYGTETDVRDSGGRLVISHDPPTGGEMTLEDLLTLAEHKQPTLALNIKADGLADDVAKAMRRAAYPRWFVFDMSVPDMRGHLAAQNPVYTRKSEFEPNPALLTKAAGVWLDGFETDQWRPDAAVTLLNQGHRVCLVSPELHRRAHEPFWTDLRNMGLHRTSQLMLCTDLPEDASRFFGEPE